MSNTGMDVEVEGKRRARASAGVLKVAPTELRSESASEPNARATRPVFELTPILHHRRRLPWQDHPREMLPTIMTVSGVHLRHRLYVTDSVS